MQTLFKRLNRPMIVATAMLALALASGIVGCKKKERLSASTFNFSITPPAATLLQTESATLTAHGFSAAGSVDVNPVWTVSGPGTLNTTIGRVVIMQPTGLGDVIVTATTDGVMATARFPIVSIRPSSNSAISNTFHVYNDNGLPNNADGSNVNSDIFTSRPFVTELSAGYTPEGVKYEHATDAGNDFWGVTFDKADVGLNKDLSSFNAGTLIFSLRLSRTLDPGETITIQLTSVPTPPSPVSFVLVSGSNGYNRLDTAWQEISIPVSSGFPGLDFAHVKVPFAIVTNSLTTPLSYDVDAVRWQK